MSAKALSITERASLITASSRISVIAPPVQLGRYLSCTFCRCIVAVNISFPPRSPSGAHHTGAPAHALHSPAGPAPTPRPPSYHRRPWSSRTRSWSSPAQPTGSAGPSPAGSTPRAHGRSSSPTSTPPGRPLSPPSSTGHGRGSALGLGCNVGIDAETTGLIDRAEDAFGPIDLFFANAGIGLGSDLETSDADWAATWAVNWQAHLYAARRLVPDWVARGEGYFCSTASAAGLLAQIGNAPYSVTKHAAVAFAEWLSIAYGDQGVRVSCLCPMGVNTNMLAGADQMAGSRAGNVVRATSDVLEPEQVAEVVVEGIRAEDFLLLPHPDVLVHLQRKSADIDRWLAGMRRLQARMAAME